MKKQLLILSSPSGGGKSTVAHHLLKVFPQFRLSVSATTRDKRPGETHGKDYYFLTKEEFKKAIEKNELIEYEEIFGNYYGTLKSEIEKSISKGELLLFDIDVKGALSLKKLYPDTALLVFLTPPTEKILLERLKNRRTETDEQIRTRFERAKMEIAYSQKFDIVLINDKLEQTFKQAEAIVKKYFL